MQATTSNSPSTAGGNERRQGGRGGGRGRGSGRGSPGRGRGRGRGSPSHGGRGHWSNKNKKHGGPSPSKPSSPNPATAKPLHIETLDFHSMHALCLAAKYKVHRPWCNCPKMKDIRARKIASTEKDESSKLTEQMGNLQLSNDKEQDKLHKRQNEAFDFLIVAPDTKGRPPAIYACKDTGKSKYKLDPRGCERRLQKEIFGDTEDTDKMDPKGGLPPFKVSCAVCLLDDDPNGFVCLASSSENGLDGVIQQAATIADRKRNEPSGLHHDHAHFVCALQVESLHRLRAQKNAVFSEAKQAVILQLQEAGVEVGCISNGILTNPNAKVKMGHHLAALLEIKKKNKSEKFLASMTHWMVIGYKDGADFWTLDLPGGKRHLGESTSECAIRETEEECSVKIDSEWIADERARQLHDGNCNLTYVLEPPSHAAG